MADKPTKERSYISGVTLSIGMLSVIGDLHTLKVTNANKAEEFKSVCPKCETPGAFLKQALYCQEEDAHGPFQRDDVLLGRQDGDKILLVDPEQVAEARDSVLPDKELELQVHTREDMEKHTFATGNAYVFRPAGSSKLYGILLSILEKRPDICLVAKVNMRRRDHLIQVDRALNNQLVIREMIWPEDMKAFDEVDYEVNPKLAQQAEELMEASVEPFNATEYRKDSRDRLATVVEETRSGVVTPKTKAAPTRDADEDFAVMLEAALNAKRKSA